MLIGTHSERLAEIRHRIAAAATRAGRDPAAITLVAVSKTHPVQAIQALHALGVSDFGESYVQEGVSKIVTLRPASLPETPWHWHFIGHLQSNKTRAVAEYFDWVHGVDRASIARRLSEQRPLHGPPLNVCLQVHIGDEPTKSGAAADEVPALATEVAQMERLHLRGLMCLPPQSENVDQQRRWFAQLRQLFERLNDQGHRLDALSMGMSGDFEAAIEEGATHVRIGTALFGERERKNDL